MRTRKRKEYCDATFHGIHHWNKSMFEQLGWMVLANAHGMNYKILAYKKSLNKLKCALHKKINDVSNNDKRADLQIMLDNLEILIKHVHKDF